MLAKEPNVTLVLGLADKLITKGKQCSKFHITPRHSRYCIMTTKTIMTKT